MLAGQSEVIEEGRDGLNEMLVTYTVVNGDVENKDEEIVEVIDEGESKVIKKGTLGLPEGEDWETYEGDPVYKNGDEIVETTMQYIGTRYRLGGYDLATGVSCIGLVKAIYAKYGVYIPMSMTGARKVGIPVSYSNMKKGDIICYSRHFAIYAGNGKILDARSRGGVGIRSLGSVGQKVLTVRRIVQ